MADAAFHTITEKEIEALGVYEIVEHRFLADINSDSYVLRHKKTGARIAILPNEDSNKVFYIGFRTPPKDSTGVAHIIEHTVLCGSRDFPVKDPFIEVVKGSLNTFLNAMTYPDKTVYPVASTNEKDFDNLMHVYLDAVFHPNIYSNENIFRQEGWHYEFVPDADGKVDEETSPLTVNGVVYNEMKGVMSSPDDVLNDKVLSSLYPHTTYSIISGGDPEFIPTLTYDAYLDFHRRYYHPSNSYIYLYGDMDMEERLRYLDEAYLSQYEALQVDSQIRPETQWEAPTESEYHYSVMDTEDTAGQTYLSMNFSIPIGFSSSGKTTGATGSPVPSSGETTGAAGAAPGDPSLENLAFKVLDYVLCDAEGAPLKEALRRKGIGQDVSSLYEAGILQPYYSIVSKYADKSQKEEFIRTIHETLLQLADNGLDPKAVLAGISYYEFHYREADFGGFPKGLVFGLDILDTWLYDDAAVWTNLNIGQYFDQLRSLAGKGYFENLIRRFLLDNQHRSVVILSPEPGLTQKNDEKMKERMASFAAGLSREQRQKIAQDLASLRAWQETPDTKEALATIPVLTRDDLKKDAAPYANRLMAAGSVPVMAHPLFTSNIDYMTFLFDISAMPAEYFRYLGVFKTLFGVLSTQQYDYAALDHEINIVTGGIGASGGIYTNTHNTNEYRITLEVNAKALHENAAAAIALVEEILLHTKYDDLDRIREVLEEERAADKAELPANGHGTAAGRATSYFSYTSAIMEEVNGVTAYRTLDDILDHWESAGKELPGKMSRIAAYIFRKENLLFDVTTDAQKVEELLPVVAQFADRLQINADADKQTLPDAGADPADTKTVAAAQDDKAPEMVWSRSMWHGFAAPSGVYHPVLEKKNEGFTTAGQIQYVCRAGNFLNKGYAYTGALRVLRVIMAYDYLWQRIRMKGGAYGCMSGYARDGCAYFVTYRDPHLKSSIETFEGAADYLRQFTADEVTMTKYVIGAISGLDRPMSPRALGRYSLTGYLTNYSYEDAQRERGQVLMADVEDIRALSDLVAAFMKDDVICVIGNAQKLEENKELFGSIEPLV